MFHVPNKYRISTAPLTFEDEEGNNGAFELSALDGILRIIASDGLGWEHVSVSLQHRVPVWREMCSIKDLFWDEEDLVIQYHPPKSEYINCHPRTLHLWRKAGTNKFCDTPPSYLIGPK